jgi:hypothetical protein
MATAPEPFPTKDVLRMLELGNSVAEFDESLEQYFVENEAFHALVTGKADVIAGDKGTGKTAVYRILQKRYSAIRQLDGVEVIPGFNPTGNPIFQKLVQQQPLTEGQYAGVWKAYFLSLVGNWILEIVGSTHSPSFLQLERMLLETGLRSKDDRPETVFSKITNTIQRVFEPRSAEIEFTLSESGIPIITPRVTFDNPNKQEQLQLQQEVPHERALRLLNDCLGEVGYSVWVAMDRLDEAFDGFPAIEVPALRALLRTYLDLLEFDRIKLKLFVRRDLFRKIIGDGFVNLTHINARKMEIVWDEADLLNLLSRRIRDNKQFIDALKVEGWPDEKLFYRLFPEKVDQAERKPTTWKWIMSRIRDGNDVKPPRNLIGLANLAREEQIRSDSRTPRNLDQQVPLFSSDAIRGAHDRLSEQRVEDTLLAEAGAEVAPLINRFRNAKAEHNLDTLRNTLRLDGDALQSAIRQLVQIGFLEALRASWKVPMLYRDGLGVTQGKAFAVGQDVDAESE